MADKLSQQEIDMLMHGDIHKLTEAQVDALGEIGNISLGSASTSLSSLLQQRVEITTPVVRTAPVEEMYDEFEQPCVVVTIRYTEGLRGENVLVIKGEDAKKIASLLLGGDGTSIQGELDELHVSAVGEVMNQMMGSAATSMSDIFQKSVNISPPEVHVVEDGELDFGISGWVVGVEFQLKVGDLIDSKMIQLIPFDFAVEMVDGLLNPAPTEPTPQPFQSIASQTPTPPSVVAPVASETVASEQASTSQPNSQRVQKAVFGPFDSNEPSGKQAPRNIEMLFDVELNVRVELGSSKKRVREILDLTKGSVVELDKLAGEPVDVFVNNRQIGVGEVVVIDENFAVRLTDILSLEDRLKTLR